MDDQSSWQKHVLVGVTMLLVVGLLVGGVVAFAGIKVAEMAGIGSTETTSVDRPDMPGDDPTTEPTQPEPKPQTPQTSKEPPKEDKRAITLVASPRRVSPNEHINLDGDYDAPDGTVLQVQRREDGAWADFDATTSVADGRFSTYIYTSISGVQHLRLIDKAAGELSNPSTVRVG